MGESIDSGIGVEDSSMGKEEEEEELQEFREFMLQAKRDVRIGERVLDKIKDTKRLLEDRQQRTQETKKT